MLAAPAVARAQAPPVSDLPLVEVPAPGPPAGGLVAAVLLTADGGWAALDRGVAAALARDGVPVVGWSSLDYYRTARTPEKAADDLARVLRHYPARWGGRRALLIGYSFGADVLPLLVNRLPPDLRPRVAGGALIGFSREAVFEFHVSNWLGVVRGREYPTLPRCGACATCRCCASTAPPTARKPARDWGWRTPPWSPSPPATGWAPWP